jgi:cytoskeletal protein CcmA (bactofilin family)
MDHSGTLTVIGAGMVIRGRIAAQGDLFVDGDVHGALDMPGCKLVVGPHGEIRADIRAREVLIEGLVRGDVHATATVAISGTGELIGGIRASGLRIESGAFFSGSVDLIEPAEPLFTQASLAG